MKFNWHIGCYFGLHTWDNTKSVVRFVRVLNAALVTLHCKHCPASLERAVFGSSS